MFWCAGPQFEQQFGVTTFAFLDVQATLGKDKKNTNHPSTVDEYPILHGLTIIAFRNGPLVVQARQT